MQESICWNLYKKPRIWCSRLLRPSKKLGSGLHADNFPSGKQNNGPLDNPESTDSESGRRHQVDSVGGGSAGAAALLVMMLVNKWICILIMHYNRIKTRFFDLDM